MRVPRKKTQHIETTNDLESHQTICNMSCLPDHLKVNAKLWYGVMHLVQMNISEAYVILQYVMIVVSVEMMKL